MDKKSKKASVKKNQENIEVALGSEEPSKYDIMVAIAKKYSIYGATVWLNTPVPEVEGRTPAELMIEGQLSIVSKLIENSNGKIDT